MFTNEILKKLKMELKGDKIIACYDFEVKTSLDINDNDANNIYKFKFVIIGDKISYRGLPYIDSEDSNSALTIILVNYGNNWESEEGRRVIRYADILGSDQWILNSSNRLNFELMCEKIIKKVVKEMVVEYCSYSKYIGNNQPVLIIPEVLDIKDIQYFGTGEINTLNFKYYDENINLWYHCSIIGDEDSERTTSGINFPVGENSIGIIEYPILPQDGLFPLSDIENNSVVHRYNVYDDVYNEIYNEILIDIDHGNTVVRHKHDGKTYNMDQNYMDMSRNGYHYIHTHTIKDCITKILNYSEDYKLEILIK